MEISIPSQMETVAELSFIIFALMSFLLALLGNVLPADALQSVDKDPFQILVNSYA